QKFMDADGEDKIDAAFAFDGRKDALEYAKHGHVSLEAEIKKNIGFWSDDHDAILKTDDENHDDDDHKQYLEGAKVFKKYRDKLDEGQRYQFESDATSFLSHTKDVPDLPNADQMSEEEKKAYAKFQAVNSSLNRSLYDEDGMKFRDHIIYSGGVEQAIRDL